MLQSKRYGKFAVILFLLLSLFHIKYGVIPGWNKIVSDFPNYFCSAKLVATRQDPAILYNDTAFNRAMHNDGIFVLGQFSLYPPSTALLMVPLTRFTPLSAKRIWLCIDVILLFTCIMLIRKITGLDFFTAGCIIMVSGFCLTNDLMLGQVYLLMLAATLSGYYFIKTLRPFRGSFLWGFVMSLKYYTIVLVPVLLWKKHFKVLAGMLISFLLINLLTLFFTGTAVYDYFLTHIFSAHLAGKINGQEAFSLQFQSFESLLNRLFVKDDVFNPYPFYESVVCWWMFKSVLYIIFTAAAVWLLFTARNSVYFFETGAAVLITLLLLLEPGSASYHLLLLVFPVVMAAVILDKRPVTAIFPLLACLAAIGFLPPVLNPLSARYEMPLFLQYSRLWLLILFYFVLLWSCYRLMGRGSQHSNNAG
jgi:hypothetical protein